VGKTCLRNENKKEEKKLSDAYILRRSS
jgi:hypothetical protein